MLCDMIKNLRISYGISQVRLAQELGVSKQCVSNWENDNVQPSIEMLIKTARFFKVSCDYLLEFDCSKTIDVSGLSETETAHLKLLIEDLRIAKSCKR